jgi:hypothetical protein
MEELINETQDHIQYVIDVNFKDGIRYMLYQHWAFDTLLDVAWNSQLEVHRILNAPHT